MEFLSTRHKNPHDGKMQHTYGKRLSIAPPRPVTVHGPDNSGRFPERLQTRHGSIHAQGDGQLRIDPATRRSTMGLLNLPPGMRRMSVLTSPNVRPFSSPGEAQRKAQRKASKTVQIQRTASSRKIYKIVEIAHETDRFEKETEQKRTEDLQEDKPETAPVFNKRLFAAHGTVIMTREARHLMETNQRSIRAGQPDTPLTRTQMLCLRCITEGLNLIHKGRDFIKDVLSKTITYEVYNAFEYISPKPWEDNISCYYILNGAVEVTYDLRETGSRNVFQTNIIYSHGTGEFTGLVSPEKPSEDLAPPATLYTKEHTQFIRIDRKRFHALMEKVRAVRVQQKRDFIASHNFFSHVPDEAKDKILLKMSIQDHPANKVLLSQGQISDSLFVVMKGRCQTYRVVFVPESETDTLFYLESRDPNDFFGEECVLDKEPSMCTVVTATRTTLLKLHRSALEMVNRESLAKYIESSRHDIPDDEELRNRGYRTSIWNRFKHGEIKNSLMDAGKLCHLAKEESDFVFERPPDENEVHAENLRRFFLKGSAFEPVRIQSARVRREPLSLPKRPKTTASPSKTEVPSVIITTADTEDDEQNIGGLGTAPEKHVPKQTTETPMIKTMEPQGRLLKGNEDIMRQAWREGVGKENFMTNTVLVTMRSADIVRKAKALVDSNANKGQTTTSGGKVEDWNTVVHAENRDAKSNIQANKLRMRDLKRRLIVLQKCRDKVRQQRLRETEPGLCALAEDVDAEEHATTTEHKDIQAVPEEDEEEEEDNTAALFRSHSAEELASLSMYQVTDKRLQLLKSWHTSQNWSVLKETGQEKDNDKTPYKSEC